MIRFGKLTEEMHCGGCGRWMYPSDKVCPVCGTPKPGWIVPSIETQCGNCHASLEAEDKYCRICGTKRGEGAYEPYEDLMQCIYGPMPVERSHVCTKCGYTWTTCLMLDDQKYCPKCGAPAPYDSMAGEHLKRTKYSGNSKTELLEDRGLAGKVDRYTAYTVSATGIFGHTICYKKYEICRIMDDMTFPVSEVTVSGYGNVWTSTFDIETTIRSGVKRSVRDTNHINEYEIVFLETGCYRIGEKLRILCNGDQYIYHLDGREVALSYKSENVEWSPKISGCEVRASSTIEIARDVPEDMRLKILSFPYLKFFS